ncbi:sporulation-specific protein 22 [Savitreella phatthalungensis]
MSTSEDRPIGMLDKPMTLDTGQPPSVKSRAEMLERQAREASRLLENEYHTPSAVDQALSDLYDTASRHIGLVRNIGRYFCEPALNQHAVHLYNTALRLRRLVPSEAESTIAMALLVACLLLEASVQSSGPNTEDLRKIVNANAQACEVALDLGQSQVASRLVEASAEHHQRLHLSDPADPDVLRWALTRVRLEMSRGKHELAEYTFDQYVAIFAGNATRETRQEIARAMLSLSENHDLAPEKRIALLDKAYHTFDEADFGQLRQAALQRLVQACLALGTLEASVKAQTVLEDAGQRWRPTTWLELLRADIELSQDMQPVDRLMQAIDLFDKSDETLLEPIIARCLQLNENDHALGRACMDRLIQRLIKIEHHELDALIVRRVSMATGIENVDELRGIFDQLALTHPLSADIVNASQVVSDPDRAIAQLTSSSCGRLRSHFWTSQTTTNVSRGVKLAYMMPCGLETMQTKQNLLGGSHFANWRQIQENAITHLLALRCALTARRFDEAKEYAANLAQRANDDCSLEMLASCIQAAESVDAHEVVVSLIRGVLILADSDPTRVNLMAVHRLIVRKLAHVCASSPQPELWIIRAITQSFAAVSRIARTENAGLSGCTDDERDVFSAMSLNLAIKYFTIWDEAPISALLESCIKLIYSYADPSKMPSRRLARATYLLTMSELLQARNAAASANVDADGKIEAARFFESTAGTASQYEQIVRDMGDLDSDETWRAEAIQQMGLILVAAFEAACYTDHPERLNVLIDTAESWKLSRMCHTAMADALLLHADRLNDPNKLADLLQHLVGSAMSNGKTDVIKIARWQRVLFRCVVERELEHVVYLPNALPTRMLQAITATGNYMRDLIRLIYDSRSTYPQDELHHLALRCHQIAINYTNHGLQSITHAGRWLTYAVHLATLATDELVKADTLAAVQDLTVWYKKRGIDVVNPKKQQDELHQIVMMRQSSSNE